MVCNDEPYSELSVNYRCSPQNADEKNAELVKKLAQKEILIIRMACFLKRDDISQAIRDNLNKFFSRDTQIEYGEIMRTLEINLVI